MERPKMSPLLIVAIVLVLGVAGIFSAVAVPSLEKARTSGNEASAKGSLLAIVSGQHVYSAACAGGGFAVTLEDLAKPATADGTPFINPDLAANGVIKSGYRLSLTRSAAAGTVDGVSPTRSWSQIE